MFSVAVYAAGRRSKALLTACNRAAAAEQTAGEQAAERGRVNKRGCFGPACEYYICSAPQSSQ